MSTLIEELEQCKTYAQEGHQLAIRQYNEIKNTLIDEARKIDEAGKKQNQMSRIKNTELIDLQKRGLEDLTSYINKIYDDIQMLHDKQKDFTITVYGRTMVGKSTLMEILTHGNGKSIGQGAQRTTRDVRSYYWKGLKIYDVPGICSFDGAEDDQLAFEAAKSADLILFLITDDGVQGDEAEELARLKSLGKPVLGVVNVKVAFDMKRKKLSLRNMQKKLMDTERLDSICAQFKEFAAQHGQDWSDIPFVYTHLNAAFQSQPERSNDVEVYQSSNFSQVEHFIIDKVRNDGKFLRMKTFIDVAAVPMQKIIAGIYEHSAATLLESGLYKDKIKQFASWRQSYIERSKIRLDNFYDEVKAQVDSAIDDFVNQNYENKNAGSDWEKVINRMDLPQRCQSILQELGDECERKRKQLSDQLTQEMKFSFYGNAKADVNIGTVTPWGKIAFQVAANALVFIPGIGWGARLAIGLGGMLIGFLFDNKEDKIRENKSKLRKALREGTYPMLENMKTKVKETFDSEILKKGVDDFGEILYEMTLMLASLGRAQYKLARTLTAKYRELNLELLQEAIEYSRQPGLLSSIDYIARIPGREFLVVAGRSSINTKVVSSLIGEHLTILPKPEQLKDLVTLILGCEFNIKTFATGKSEQDKKAKLLKPTNKINDINFTLAQQVAGVPIINN